MLVTLQCRGRQAACGGFSARDRARAATQHQQRCGRLRGASFPVCALAHFLAWALRMSDDRMVVFSHPLLCSLLHAVMPTVAVSGSPLMYGLGSRIGRNSPVVTVRGGANKPLRRPSSRPSTDAVDAVVVGDSDPSVDSLMSEIRLLRGDSERLAAAQAMNRSLLAQMATARQEVDALRSKLEGPEHAKTQVSRDAMVWSTTRTEWF